MPVNPLLLSALRRNLQLLGAALVLLVLVVLHLSLFQPTQARYARALQALGGADAVLDPDQGPVSMPPRVFALVAENAMPAAELDQRSASGQLTTLMLEDLSGMASRSGLAVTLSEPGVISPFPTRVEARVHLKVRGDYREVIAFLEAMEASGRLYDLERYAISDFGSDLQLEVWVVRMLLKQSGATR